MSEQTSSDPTLWAALAAGIAGIGTSLGRAFKTGRDVRDLRLRMHRLDDIGQATILRTAILESKYQEIDRRLGSIEAKLDRALER